MTTRAFHRSRRQAAVLLAALVAGGGAGAGVYAGARGGTSVAATTVTVTKATPVAATSSWTLTLTQLYARAVKGVVEVDVTTRSTIQTPFGDESRSASAQGTGFVYDTSGDIVTNAHVVSGATSIKVKLSGGKTYTATLVGSDPSTDVAVLHIDAPSSQLHPLTLGDSSAVQVGEAVVAIGDPYGLDGTMTSGIVSAVGRTITAPNNAKIHDAIQTDAAINHGNSGGVLLDVQGEVIGVTSQIESTSGDNAGVGFAVSSNTAKAAIATILGAQM